MHLVLNEAEQFDPEVGLCKQPVVLVEHRLARRRVDGGSGYVQRGGRVLFEEPDFERQILSARRRCARLEPLPGCRIRAVHQVRRHSLRLVRVEMQIRCRLQNREQLRPSEAVRHRPCAEFLQLGLVLAGVKKDLGTVDIAVRRPECPSRKRTVRIAVGLLPNISIASVMADRRPVIKDLAASRHRLCIDTSLCER